jgi:hypothetical protein
LHWDNWRNIWVYRQNSVWLTNVVRPTYVVKVKLENEKSVELKENEDDIDDVYYSNETYLRDTQAKKITFNGLAYTSIKPIH